jgi:hypothetical protein
VAQLTGSFVLVGTETVVHDSGAAIKLLAIPARLGSRVNGRNGLILR